MIEWTKLLGGVSLSVLMFGPLCAQDFSVLVFSRTDGFRHSSIGPGTDAVRQLGKLLEQCGFELTYLGV